MYIFKNAIKSITRSLGRNFLVGIIIVVIAASSCVALSIKNAAAKAESQGIQALNVTAQISLDREKVMAKAQTDGKDFRTVMQSYSDLTLEQLETYKASTYVSDFYYTLSSSINASGTLEPVDTSATTTASAAATSTITPQKTAAATTTQQNKIPGGMGAQGDFTIVGYSSEQAMTSFIAGTSKISDGAVFDIVSSDLNCIISNELAKLNSLKVGDTISLANPNSTTEIYEFTIKGIYTNTSTTGASTGGMRFSTANDPANQIYCSYNALKAVVDKSTASATTSTDSTTGTTNTTALRNQVAGTFVLPDVNSYNSFKEDATKLGLSEYYTVSSQNVTNYEKSLEPLKSLNNYATYFLFIVLGIGGIILIVFNLFSIRERKFEIGVLTAIGMKKRKVGIQFITEVFMVTIIAIIIGTAVGSATSVPIANKLLASQVTSQQAQVTTQSQNFGRGMGGPQGGGPGGAPTIFSNQAVNYINNIDAAINLEVVAQLLGIGLLLTIISSSAAVISIMRYEPLKILSNRA